jgi:hypothetical protein
MNLAYRLLSTLRHEYLPSLPHCRIYTLSNRKSVSIRPTVSRSIISISKSLVGRLRYLGIKHQNIVVHTSWRFFDNLQLS